jgi:hypothetical protein
MTNLHAKIGEEMLAGKMVIRQNGLALKDQAANETQLPG